MGAEPKAVGPSSVMKLFYIFLNVFSAVSIVFANKLVLTTYRWAGMLVLSRSGFFTAKSLAAGAVAPLALGYVGYIILNNLSLQLNTVGFYQILKIAIAPTVMLLDFVLFRKMQTWRIMASVAVVCVGVTAATVTDHVAISNVVGLGVGLASVVVTALYQIWAGSKQKELQANSSQLLLAYTPQAIVLLSVMVPMLDDLGMTPPAAGAARGTHTVLGYPYNLASVSAIVISALLGILVSLSTFLVIGATSSLTYNIVGHFKTILILAGGCLLFGESMPWKRLAGIALTMCGIAWYTYLSIVQVPPSGGGAHREPEILRDRSGHRGGGGEREPLLTGSSGGSGDGAVGILGGTGGVGLGLGGSRV
ncbi:hypothetical protein CHLRE_15g641266v5 [Chlamydomonas reinhardtii]|uniref:Sugar phosphate transporter domain-containing protein n=1 Tax=Chlamydomonas reinhardtii TaxID=3055 RepID=A0A2K3CWT9_CHLRE|nr:uncharacterized protein CHLRE_15g641266v5 [Chlamydomonas reinhardtii]PNW72757.1 hypothetical protein CHLRE_15g641266v5 [Chlamydomonas reinhardtii]